MNDKEYESSSEYATSEEEKPKAIRKNVKPVEGMTSGEAMKFAVSGGVTTIEEEEPDATKVKL